MHSPPSYLASSSSATNTTHFSSKPNPPQPNRDRPCHSTAMPGPPSQEGLTAVALRTMHASNCPLQGPNPASDHHSLGRERASPLDAQHRTRPQKLCLSLPDKPLPLSSGLASSQPGLRGQRPAVANTSPPPDQNTTPKLPQEENTQPPFSHKGPFRHKGHQTTDQ